MRKLKSLIKKSDIKSFVLGLALAVVISFGVTGVLAVNNQNGDIPSNNTSSVKDVKKFMGQEGGLVNKIGSLTIGSQSTDSWILDPANKCLTVNGGDSEKQSCLSVHGTPSASFSKLTVLDMPAFIQGSSLFLNVDGNQGILAGLPNGLVIDDFAGTDDSIMASSLQYEVNNNLAPRNLDEQRNLCADPVTGRLVICNEPAYHWEVGDWSDCSAGGSGTCSGTWTTTGTGSCTGTYNVAQCNGSWVQNLKIDWNGYPFDWVLGETYDDQGNTTSFGEYPRNQVQYISSTSSYVWFRKTCGLCSWSSYGLAYNEVTNYCSAGNPIDSASCLRNNSTNGNACSWDVSTYQCSDLGVTNQSDCEGGSVHETCVWDNGADTINYCEDKDGTSQSECESYNNACSWTEGGDATKTRTVVCKDASGNTVADSFCTGDKPATSEACTVSSYTCTGNISAGCRSDTQDGLLEGSDIRSGTCSGDYWYLQRSPYPDQQDTCEVDNSIVCSDRSNGDINDCVGQIDQFCSDQGLSACDWNGDPLDCTAQYSEQSCNDLYNYSDLAGTDRERPCTWDESLTTPCSAINPQNEQECIDQNQQATGSNCAWVITQ